MQTVMAFLVAIGLLVAVHEWGHFFVARCFGVKVLRFSIGFGPKVLGWTAKGTGTEYVVSAIPLGGYVKMLDGREGPVPEEDAGHAFDGKSLWVRAAVVVAGPLANLLLAVMLYACINWQVTPQAMAVLPSPIQGSLAAVDGWKGGERVSAIGYDAQALEPIHTFDALRWWLTKASLAGRTVWIQYADGSHADAPALLRPMHLAPLGADAVDASLFQKIGWVGPFSSAQLGDLTEGGAAQAAGLQAGDRVLQVDGMDVVDAAQLRALIKQSPGKPLLWLLERRGEPLRLTVTPRTDLVGAAHVGRIGAYVGAAPETMGVQYGFLEGLRLAVEKTWDIAAMSLETMGQMLIGQVSLKSLNGPLAIADYAGKSAAMGLLQFTAFLALISISLGVLNLLPLPVLDGGHLMYYLWEGLTGNAVPERWWDALQRMGVALLLVMMSIAFYNDVLHILG